MGCSYQQRSGGIEVPGKVWRLQSPMEHLSFAEERLCYVRTTSPLSFLPPSLTQLPPPLLSAAVWFWQQICGPGLKWGLCIPGRGGPFPRRSPAGLSDPRCLLMVPQVY